MDNCVPWPGYLNRRGYGCLRYNGKWSLAHRVAWEKERGPIPPGVCVLHRCDNPPCINPDHLFLGTQLDNIADRHRKGRNGRLPGESNGRARLTEAQVRAIRSDTRSKVAIAQTYGISNVLVGLIKRRKIWKHVPDDFHTVEPKPKG